MHQGLVPAPATAKQQLDHILHSKLPVAREEGPIKGLSKLIKAVSDEQLIGAGLQPPAVPQLCLHSIAEDQPLTARLQAVQSFISAFEYNQCIGYNHNVLKQRPLQAILATAAGILAHPLPIKCIEAVFLGILLTQGWSQLQRLPVGFKSKGADGQVYRHIVLALCDTSTRRYGALGISRCSQLMDKPLQYSSLAALVQDYHQAYRQVRHELLRVRIGLPVEHDPGWMGPVCWRLCTVNMQRRSWQEAAGLLDRHAEAAAELQQQFRQAVAHAGASGGCGTRSLPQSPRGSPKVARPHSALRVRCGTPDPGTEQQQQQQQQHLPALTSPRKQQSSGPAGAWRSPSSPSCCSSSPASPRAAAARSPAGHRGCQSPLVSPGKSPQGRRLPGGVGGGDLDQDEAGCSDSDSDVDAVAHQLLQLLHCS